MCCRCATDVLQIYRPSKCLSMPLNVSQCFSMSLNASQCLSVHLSSRPEHVPLKPPARPPPVSLPPATKECRGESRRMEKRRMILEPCAARAASVPHNPPLERQASWHQCLTECQRVEQLVSAECAQRMKSHADRFAERWEGPTKSRAYHVTSLAATLLAL